MRSTIALFIASALVITAGCSERVSVPSPGSQPTQPPSPPATATADDAPPEPVAETHRKLTTEPLLEHSGIKTKPKLWLVVGRPGLVEPLAPLIAWRESEGFRTSVSTAPVADAIASSVVKPDFILLIGDDAPGCEDRPWYLPAKRRSLYRWQREQERTFASDSAWGDLDGDTIQDVPVGRIPARTGEEVTKVVAKILAYECQEPSVRDLKLHVWLGNSQYPPPLDTMSTQILTKFLGIYSPGWVESCVLAGDKRSVFCGWPPMQPQRFSRDMRRGGFLAVMTGHAYYDQFYSMEYKGGPIWFSDRSAEEHMSRGQPTMPLLLITCYAGDFTQPRRCLAESCLMLTGGPVATVGATTASHPLTNSLLSLSYMKLLDSGEQRLGKLWLQAQLDSQTARDLVLERLLRDVEGKLEPEIDVKKLKRDQVFMYAILGDPATRIRLPRKLAAKVERIEDGWRWRAARVRGVETLEIGVRSASVSHERLSKEVDGAGAMVRLNEARQREAYRKIATMEAGDTWGGVVGSTFAKAGDSLRIVAIGPDVRRAAALTLPAE